MVRRHRNSAAETTLTVVATICFLPCICLIGGAIVVKDLFYAVKRFERSKTRIRRMEKTKRQEVLRNSPKQLGRRLERHLTIGREATIEIQEPMEVEETERKEKSHVLTEIKPSKAQVAKKRQSGRTDNQLGSSLFNLPLEIRRQIWEEVLGGYVLHMYFVEAYRRMSHTRCKTHFPDICTGQGPASNPCRNTFKVPGARDKWGQSNLLSLLQSCRQIYSEAIPFLYERNTFRFESLLDVMRFSQTVLPERMRLIKDIRWKLSKSHGVNYDSEFMPWLKCNAPSSCWCIKHWELGGHIWDSMDRNGYRDIYENK